MALTDSKVLDRLINQLNTSPTAKADQPLWQVIIQLIRRLKEIESAVSSAGGGGGSTIINEITEQTFIIQEGGGDGEDGPIGPPGIRGADGAIGPTGPAGPPTIGPMGIDGVDGDDGYPIPGPRGAQGPTGLTGPAGPPTIGPMGIDGADGDDGLALAATEFARINVRNFFKALQTFKTMNITPYDNGNSGAALTIDWNNSNTQYVTLDSNCVFTFSNPIDGLRVVLLVKGGFTVTWPASVEWPGGTAPTISDAGSWDLFTFIYKSAEAKYVGSFNLDYTL